MDFSYEEIQQAYERLQPYVPATPLLESYYLGNDEQKIYFEMEALQRTKSFKIRGALNKMLTLTEDEKKRGVATISSGNHGSSVSLCSLTSGNQECNILNHTG